MPHSLETLLNLSNQVAIITGASRGIGQGIARLFHQAGAKLTLVARTPGPLQNLATELSQTGPHTLALPADIAEEQQVNTLVQKTLDEFGRIDILINNAGLMSAGRYPDIDAAEWARVINANLTGAYYCARAVAPHLEKQKSGRIINISSISAQTGGVSGGVHYASSKGGMLAMTKTLSRDLASAGVTVNAITPGVIDTSDEGLVAETRRKVEAIIPLGCVGQPEDIAYAALFLASPMAAYITGATLDVNGGILKR